MEVEACISRKLSWVPPTPSSRDLSQSSCQLDFFHKYWLHFSISQGLSYYTHTSYYIVLPSGGTQLLALQWTYPECCCSENFVNKGDGRTIKKKKREDCQVPYLTMNLISLLSCPNSSGNLVNSTYYSCFWIKSQLVTGKRPLWLLRFLKIPQRWLYVVKIGVIWRPGFV